MKKLLLLSSVIILVSGISFAQDDSEVTLDSFELCNNWARYYCQMGNHEKAVNAELLGMKKRGVIITVKLIKSVSQRVPKDTYVPPEK